MAKEIKFTDDELNGIKELRDAHANKVLEFGRVKVELLLTEQRLNSLKDAEENLNNEYRKLQEQEAQLVQKFNEKYGVGTVDLESGTFNPAN
tara:strand:- start:34 stop:309 length:276 start_codon:yes stop_codon:yes gene_type:complete